MLIRVACLPANHVPAYKKLPVLQEPHVRAHL